MFQISLYMSLFLHQTTTSPHAHGCSPSCICLYSYIKPQLRLILLYLMEVVYVSIPTSNHNLFRSFAFCRRVVYVSIPTSNHNSLFAIAFYWLLYMSLFLHQTTTQGQRLRKPDLLYMSLFLHQTTTSNHSVRTCTLLYMSLFLHQTTTVRFVCFSK